MYKLFVTTTVSVPGRGVAVDTAVLEFDERATAEAAFKALGGSVTTRYDWVRAVDRCYGEES